MAKVKKQKVLRFKNTPVKKEQHIVVKKKEVILPSKTTERIVQKTSESTKEKTVIASSVHPQEKQQSEKVLPETFTTKESDSSTAIPGSDTFLLSSFGKKTNTGSYFPKISRVITERWFLTGSVCGMLLVGIIIVGGNIQANIQERKDLEQKRANIQHEITYWQESAQKYPGNRDAYFQLALLEYQLGDAQSSQRYLNKVESIDPNFQEAYTLEKMLVSKR